LPWVIHPLIPSRMAIEASRLTYMRNCGREIMCPCTCFALLGGPEPVLVDSSAPAEVMAGLRIEPVEHVRSFEEALGQVGLKSEDIGLVIHTHLMYDHCANSKRLPKARFVVQRRELDFAFDPHPMVAGAYHRQFFEGLDFEVVDGDRELLPGLKILFTPGHTPGDQSVAVETAAGLAVITGFCTLDENFAPSDEKIWETDRPPEVIPPGLHTDMVQSYESALRVKRLADIILPFHEPRLESCPRIPTA